MKRPDEPTCAYASILHPEVSQPMYCPSYGRHQLAATDPRAEADVAEPLEPPAIVIHKTHRPGLCKATLREAILDGSYRRRTFYKADRVPGPASNRVACGSTAAPLPRKRLCGRCKCCQDQFCADFNSDPDRSEQTPSIATTADDTNPCHDDCGEADFE